MWPDNHELVVSTLKSDLAKGDFSKTFADIND